jgi:hypothetical protein
MNGNTTRTRIGAFGTIFVASAFAIAGGLPGLLAAVVVGVSWYALPSIVVFTIGQFALGALVSPEQTPLLLLIAEGGLLGILSGATAETNRSAQSTAFVVGCIALFAVGSWASYHWLDSIWRTTAVLAVAVTVGAYGLHRYERIALGLVTDTPPPDHE